VYKFQKYFWLFGPEEYDALEVRQFSQFDKSGIGNIVAQVDSLEICFAGFVSKQFFQKNGVGIHQAVDLALPDFFELIRHRRMTLPQQFLSRMFIDNLHIQSPKKSQEYKQNDPGKNLPIFPMVAGHKNLSTI
jgi:hypothetical protein